MMKQPFRLANHQGNEVPGLITQIPAPWVK